MKQRLRTGMPIVRSCVALICRTVGLAAFVGQATPCYAQARPRPARTAAPVVLISIDGLRPDYVLDADRYGLAIPNLRRLAREGAHASAVTGVLPTVTYPSHTTIVTGVAPARHGILANNTFDPLRTNLDGWYWYAEDIRVPTLWDAAADAGLPAASVDWPVTVGARIKWNIPQYWRTRVVDAPDDRKLARVLSTPGLLAETEKVLGPYPSGYGYTFKEDRRRAAFSVYLLEAKRPRLHLAYLSGLDEEQHETGPGSPEALAALEQIDGMVGDIRAAAERAGGGQAVIAIVSDHGHVRTDRELYLSEALRAAGLILLDERGKTTAWRAAAWGGGGGCAAILLRDPGDEQTRRAVDDVLARLSALPGNPIQRVLDRDAARAAGGFSDASYVVCANAPWRIASKMEGSVTRPALPRGEHGYLPENPQMDASFFVAGPSVPAGLDLGRIDMRDVAPTLAGLLGVPLPSAEGRNVFGAGPAPR